MRNPREVVAVLQAGGQGKRMSAGDLPKPLRAVAGTPMIERLLRQLVSAGFRDVAVILGDQGDRIEQHIRAMRQLPQDLALSWVHESCKRGNVGSLAEVQHAGKPVLLCFCDLVTDLDFSRLVRIHLERGSDITLTSHYESHRLKLGEIEFDGEHVLAYREKPEKRFLICSGIAVFEAAVLDLIDPSRPVGIVDLVTAALEDGRRVTHWVHGAFWRDVNTPNELREAEAALGRLLESGPSS